MITWSGGGQQWSWLRQFVHRNISTYAMIHSDLIKKLQEQDELIKTKRHLTKTKHSGC